MLHRQRKRRRETNHVASPLPSDNAYSSTYLTLRRSQSKMNRRMVRFFPYRDPRMLGGGQPMRGTHR